MDRRRRLYAGLVIGGRIQYLTRFFQRGGTVRPADVQSVDLLLIILDRQLAVLDDILGVPDLPLRFLDVLLIRVHLIRQRISLRLEILQRCLSCLRCGGLPPGITRPAVDPHQQSTEQRCQQDQAAPAQR